MAKQSQFNANRSYTVTRGDNLWRVAEKSCGDPRRWKEVARLNGLKSPYRVLVGQVLKIPDCTRERPKSSRAFCSRLNEWHPPLVLDGQPTLAAGTRELDSRAPTRPRLSAQAGSVPNAEALFPATEFCGPAVSMPVDHEVRSFRGLTYSMRWGFTGTLTVQRLCAVDGLSVSTDGLLEYTTEQKLWAATDLVAILAETKITWNMRTQTPEFSGGIVFQAGEAIVKMEPKPPKTLRFTQTHREIDFVKKRPGKPDVKVKGQGGYWIEFEPNPNAAAVLVENIAGWIKDADGKWIPVLKPNVLIPVTLLTLAVATVSIAGRLLAGFVEAVARVGSTAVFGLILVTPELQRELDRIQGLKTDPGVI